MIKIPKLKKPNLKIKLNFKKDTFKKTGAIFDSIQNNTKKIIKKIFTPRVKRTSLRVLTGLVILVALTQVVFAVLIYAFRSEDIVTVNVAKYVPYPIAMVDYSFVTYKDYLNEKNYIHHFYSATDQDAVDYKEIDSQIINQLIENKVIAHQLSAYDIKVSNSDVDVAISAIIDQNGGKEKVEKVLKDLYGLSLKEFRKLVKVQLERDKINDQVISRVTASHILIRVDKDAAQDKVDAAKVKIDDILNQVKGGLDFAEAAKKYSEDTGSSEQGGKLDAFARGEMVDPFSDTAFTTNLGEISQPVRTEFGWHIIKVENKTGKVDKKFADWTNDLKNKAIIYKFFDIKN